MSTQKEKTKALDQLSVKLEAISSIDILTDHLETLSRIKGSASGFPRGAHTHYRHILEEAFVAYNQMATLLDEFYQELAYHQQRFQEAQTQQINSRAHETG